MRIARYKARDGLHLGVCVNNEVIDITNLGEKSFHSFMDLASEASKEEVTIADFVKSIVNEASTDLPVYPYERLEGGEDDLRLIIPLDPPEVWGCGITYKRSREATGNPRLE